MSDQEKTSREPDNIRHLPDIGDEQAPGDTASDSPVRNSARDKIIVVTVLVLVLVGAAGAFFFLSKRTPAPDAAQAASAMAPSASAVGPSEAPSVGETPGSIPLPRPASRSISLVPSDKEPVTQKDRQATTVPSPSQTSHRKRQSTPGEVEAERGRGATDDFSNVAEALRKELGQVRQALASRADTIQAEVQALDERVAALSHKQEERVSTDLASLEKRLSAIEKRLVALDRRSKANWRLLHGDAGARRQGRRLPFKVESIDWWGAKPSVAVVVSGERRFLSPGDTVAGWRLASVDESSREARFVRNGRQALVRVSP